MRKAVLYNKLGQFPVCCAGAFYEGDGLRQNGAVAAQDAIDDLLARKRAASAGGARNQLRRFRRYASGANTQRALVRLRQSGMSSHQAAVQNIENSLRRYWNHCARAVHAHRAGLV